MKMELLQVSSPYGNNYHTGDHIESGNFAFTAAEEGDYTACFWAPQHKPPLTVTIDFDWRTGVAAKDWSKVAKKGQVEVSDVLLPVFLNGFGSFLCIISRPFVNYSSYHVWFLNSSYTAYLYDNGLELYGIQNSPS